LLKQQRRLGLSPKQGDPMQLVKHFERGYGHATETTTDDGRIGYIVRFFDCYDNQCLFYPTDFTVKVLEFIEDEEKAVRF